MALLAITTHALHAPAQQVVFAHADGWAAAPALAIDSIKATQPPMLDVFLAGKAVSVQADTMYMNRDVPDTLCIHFLGDNVIIQNPRLDLIQAEASRADVRVTSTGRQPFVCLATGSSNDGRLVIDNDTTLTLALAGLALASQKGSAISMPQKHETRIVLADGTSNTLSDGSDTSDLSDSSNGCLYAKGSLTFAGSGTLAVTGNRRHAIACGKNITVEDGHIIVCNAARDGLRCDKLLVQGGTIELNVATDASKGIKCKESFCMTGGHILGYATGNTLIDGGETTYCSLMKSDGSFFMDGGEVTLRHLGDGGRCISVDGNMTMAGGTLNLECHGDGSSYLTAANDTDYYTPKCITVDDSLHIKGGTVRCTSTGLGGKGIVAGNYLAIGKDEGQGPTVRIETSGECIVDNVDEDRRFGCPKGIKANGMIHIGGGDIAVHTSGTGGEGVESKGEMLVTGGNIECNTFDDGINVGRSIEIAGGQVYCNSTDGDGIDSNGSITISGGIIASVNRQRPDESLDSEEGQLRLFGGTVFGIGSAPVEMRQAACPYYSTPYDEPESHLGGLILTGGKYVYAMRGNEVVMALRNDNRAFRAFLTVTAPAFSDGEQCSICEGETPIAPDGSLFDGKMLIGGQTNNTHRITDIQVHTKQ